MAIFRNCHGSSALIYGLILILYHLNVYYDNILDKFEFECSRAKFKVTVAILEKHCHCSRAFIYGLILTLLHTNMKYDNILNTFEFKGFKVKATMAILKKNIVITLVSSFVD